MPAISGAMISMVAVSLTDWISITANSAKIVSVSVTMTLTASALACATCSVL